MSLHNLLDKYYSISLIGMCKNAGKTTVLNKLVEAFSREDMALGLTSVGRDGESADVVTFTPKPEIFAPRGTLVATAKQLALVSTTTTEILHTTGINTPLGEVIVFRALSRGYIQIAGPSITKQLALISSLFSAHGADKMLIDGAVSRRSLSANSVSEATVLSTGAALGPNMSQVVSQTAFAVMLLTLPVTLTTFPPTDKKYILHRAGAYVHTDSLDISRIDASALYFSGGITDNVMKPLLSKIGTGGMEFVAEDASKIFLSEKVYKQLMLRGVKLTVSKDVNLTAVTVNPVSPYGYAFDASMFKDAMQSQTNLPVFDVVRDL